MGGFLTNSEKCNAKEKSKNKQTNFEKLSHASRGLATIIYRFYRTIFTVPDMRSQWGFQQFVPNVWFSSRVPMVNLIGLYEDETGKFPDNYTVPYTSLQDWSLACNGTFRSGWFPHFVARWKSRVQMKPFKSDVRHPRKGSGPLDEESYWQTS